MSCPSYKFHPRDRSRSDPLIAMMKTTCATSSGAMSAITTDRARTCRWPRTHRSLGRSIADRIARSWRYPKSAVFITATRGAPHEFLRGWSLREGHRSRRTFACSSANGVSHLNRLCLALLRSTEPYERLPSIAVNVATEKNIDTLRQVSILPERDNSCLHPRLQELDEPDEVCPSYGGQLAELEIQ